MRNEPVETSWSEVVVALAVMGIIPFSYFGTGCLKTKHKARCQRAVANPREMLSGTEMGLGVPCTPLLDSLEKPGIALRRP